MKRPMKIGVDLDGTLAAYQSAVVDFENRAYGASRRLSDVKRDDCYDILGKTIVSRALKLKKFYRWSNSLSNISPVEGSQAAIRKLRARGYKLFAVTSRFRGFSKKTDAWLDKKFGKDAFGEVLFSNILASYSRIFKARKYAKLGVDIVIEDSAYVAKKCAERGIRVFLLDYPWNRGFKAKGVTRVENWGAVLKAIK